MNAAVVWLDLLHGEARLRVVAADGVEVTADAPADVAVRSHAGRHGAWVLGSDLVHGVPVGPVRGDVEADLTVVLCTKANGSCERTSWSVAADVGDLRRGSVFLSVVETKHDSPFGKDAAVVAERTFAAARLRNVPVLLDFSAVWCPPCNRLAAEVLHADPVPKELAAVEVAVIDADDGSSWALKDRYAVTAYPTIVLTAVDGTERSRIVGYPGRDAFLGWLATSSAGASQAERALAGPAASSPAEAAAMALAVIGQGGEAAAWIARAEEGDPESADLRAARFASQHGLADLDWLVAHRPVTTWLGSAVEWGDASAAATVVAAVRAALPEAKGLAAVDLLDALITFEPARRSEHAAAAAAMLRTTLSGDPESDKGFLADLAVYMEKAGRVEAALRFLDEESAARPGDPTFLLTASKMASRARQYDGALARADAGFAMAWGDNRLRLAAARAEALIGLDQGLEAQRFILEVLAEAPPPTDVAVRTHRYRKDLETLLARIQLPVSP